MTRTRHAPYAVLDLVGPLDRELVLDSGTRATVGDVMAAMAYAALRR